jgi:hypothetical protein
MKYILRNILLFSLSIVLVNCDEDEVSRRDYPRLKTLPVSEITSEGAKFNAEIIFRGGFEVINYGFVWGENENPTKENSDRVIYSENIQYNEFSEIIETTLKEGVSYYVRAFVETDDFVVYGENVTFLSLGSNGPELIDFIPKNGHLEDTIRISGSNFGRIKSNVEVEINQIKVELVEFKETELSVLIPNSLSVENSTISVSVSGNVTSFEEEFRLLKPIISNLSPTDVTFGSMVVIEGENFNTVPNKVLVEFIGTNEMIFSSEIISISENRIETKVPLNLDSKESEISISMNNFKVIGNQKITIQDPVVNSFSPQSGKTLTEITIMGENFSSISANNTVLIDGYPAEIVSAENDKLIAIVPDQSNHIYSIRQVEVTIEVLSSETQTTDQFNITDKWFRLDDLPFGRYAWKGLTINNEGYVLFQGGLWKYNHVTDLWSELTPFPDMTRASPGIFSISNKIYLGAGSNSTNRNNKDFWEYDISTDAWIQKDDFPGEPRTGPLAFSIGTNGYIGAGAEFKFASCCSGYNDVWQYDSNLDTWSVIPDFPLSTAEYRGYWRMVSTELNNEVYVGLGTSAVQGSTNNEVYKYSKISNEWIRIEDYPTHAQFSHIDGVAFTVDNQAFFGSGEYPDVLWSYDGSSWNSQESGSRVGRNGGFSFVINNIAFLGGGEVGNQFWLFDSSQPD